MIFFLLIVINKLTIQECLIISKFITPESWVLVTSQSTKLNCNSEEKTLLMKSKLKITVPKNPWLRLILKSTLKMKLVWSFRFCWKRKGRKTIDWWRKFASWKVKFFLVGQWIRKWRKKKEKYWSRWGVYGRTIRICRMKK